MGPAELGWCSSTTRIASLWKIVLSRSADERVEVELDARPAPATGTRFDELRETQGVAAWVLTVPRGQERTVEATVEITYPEDLELRRW